jgi:hypothetical protein
VFIEFAEGRRYVAAHGWPATTLFLLSRKSVEQPPLGVTRPTWDAADTLAAAAEAAGDGYERQSAATRHSGSEVTFGTVRWDTAAAADWPADVRSVAAVTPGGTLLCAWDTGGLRDLSNPDTTYEATPVYRL